MIDVFLLNRERMINSMQSSLKVVRQICGWSAQELGEYIGVTRQTINNIENQKTSMSATQYVALCAVLDKKVKEEPHIMQTVVAVLSGNDRSNKQKENQFFNNDDGVILEDGLLGNIDNNTTFLEKWFLSFPKVKFNTELLNNGEVFNEKGLITIAKHYKVFVNADTLGHTKAEEFFDKFTLLLKEFNNKIIVPLRVIKLMQDNILSFNSDVYIPAKRGLNLLAKLQAKGVIDIRGEASDNAVNNLIQSVFAKHRTTYRLLLLTQNEELAEDILTLNNSKTIKGYPIVAGKLNDDGILEEFNDFSLEDLEIEEDSIDVIYNDISDVIDESEDEIIDEMTEELLDDFKEEEEQEQEDYKEDFEENIYGLEEKEEDYINIDEEDYGDIEEELIEENQEDFEEENYYEEDYYEEDYYEKNEEEIGELEEVEEIEEVENQGEINIEAFGWDSID